jgi:hypothetical protein
MNSKSGGIMSITIKDIEAIRRHLSELPRNQPTEVSKQEAIALLATELGSAERRGYKHAELARLLSEHGIAINTATLRGYLRRGRKSRKRERERARTTPATGSMPPAQPPRSIQTSAGAVTAASATTPARSPAVGMQDAIGAPGKSGAETRGGKEPTATGK